MAHQKLGTRQLDGARVFQKNLIPLEVQKEPHIFFGAVRQKVFDNFW